MNRVRARRPQQDLDQDRQEQESSAFGGYDSELMGGAFGNAFAQERLRSAFPYQQEAEAAFGEDLSDLEVHTGQGGDMDAIDAEASAEGDVLRFSDTDPDKETVMHEVAHAVQARQSGQASGSALSEPDERAEVEAEGVARKAARGEPVQVSAKPEAGVMRRKRDKYNVQPDENLVADGDKYLTSKGGKDPSKRSKLNGASLQLTAETDIYNGRGRSIGKLNPATHPTGVNVLAGQEKTIQIGSERLPCLLVWAAFVDPSHPERRVTGWVPLRNIGVADTEDTADDEAKRDADAQSALWSQASLEGSAAKLRKDDKGKALRRSVRATAVPGALSGARLAGHKPQHEKLKPPSAAGVGANLADHYYAQNGVVNLLLNVPQSGEERVGTAVDVLPVGAKFSPAEVGEKNVLAMQPRCGKSWADLAGKSKKYLVTCHEMTFVYGKSGSKWGWINEAVLS